jgi:ribosomal protein L7/L12
MEALITNGAMATDGGSISLTGVDPEGAPLSVFLDWSINAQRTGTRRLEVNGHPLAIGSIEEVQFLQLLTTATVQDGVADLVNQLLTNVTSLAYSKQKAASAKPSDLDDEILELVLDGKDVEALKVYRRANPDVSLSDAKAAVEKLKNS